MINGFTLTEALNTLENGDWHAIAYVSADRKKKEAGRIIRIPECRILAHENRHQRTGDPHQPKPATAGKSQNHSLNATRNVRLRNGLVRKFNIYLLFSLDNLPVL